MLTFRFSGADGVMVESDTLTSGMTGKTVKLEFSNDWDGLQKTAVFTAGPTTKDVLNVTDEAVIPHEVLQNYGDRLYVGIYGVAGDGTITPTIYARGPRILRGADPSGDESAEASPPVWAQLQTQIDDLKNGGNSVTIDATLTQEGHAADAKAVGDKLTQLAQKIPTAAGGMSAEAAALLITILRNVSYYSSDQSDNITALENAFMSDEAIPETPEAGVVQTGSILSIVSGVTASQSGAVLSIE